MIVEVKKQFIIDALLDPKEPLTHGIYGGLTEEKRDACDGYWERRNVEAATPATKEDCRVCAVGVVIRNVLDSNIKRVSAVACHAASRTSFMHKLEALFEDGPDERVSGWPTSYYRKDGSPNMRMRRKLAAFVEREAGEWVEIDVDGATEAELRKTKAIRVKKED